MSFNRFRRNKNAAFSTIDNTVTRDKTLSLKAKGLILTIMGLPDDWDFSVRGIVAIVKEGKAAVYSAINELREAGYVTRSARYENGKIVEWVYDFYERPVETRDDLLTDFQEVENLEVENQDQENRTQLKKQRIKDTLHQETTNAQPLRGRAGIPRNYLPLTTSSSELNIWLDAVAVAVGAKDRHALPKFTKWERACMTAVREQHDLHIFLQVIEAEKKRNAGQEEYFSPDTCLQKLQLSKAKAATTDGGKWTH